MPITIVATPNDPLANSFETLAEANAYMTTRPGSDAWFDSDVETQKAALVMGTRLLSVGFPWTGAASTATQALVWGRTGMLSATGFDLAGDVIPQQLKDALSEMALYVIQDVTRLSDIDAGAQGIKRIKAGSAEIEYQVPSQYFSLVTSRLIPDIVKSMLVPSWYIATVDSPFIFEAI